MCGNPFSKPSIPEPAPIPVVEEEEPRLARATGADKKRKAQATGVQRFQIPLSGSSSGSKQSSGLGIPS
jgi:hypothetical protein